MKFKPTFLYIKEHTKTGKLYFGKTTRKDPEKYFGSGTYWKRHIINHGKQYVITRWSERFFDRESIEDFALLFSEMFDIVASDKWANLTVENGLDGGVIGLIQTKDHKEKNSLGVSKSWTPERRKAQSEARRGKKQPTGHGQKVSQSTLGKKKTYEHKLSLKKSWTPERRKAQSLRQEGRKLNDDHKVNISKSWTEDRRKETSKVHTGKVVSAETKTKLSLAFTKHYNILCPDGDTIYNISIKDFSLSIGAKEGTVTASKNRKGSFRGYIFNSVPSNIDGDS